MEAVDSVIVGLLALGCLASLALAVPVAGGALTHRRVTSLAVAALLAAGMVWLPLHARSTDTYFGAGDVSRWDFATRNGRGGLVVAAGAVAVAALAVAAAAALSGPRSVWRRAAMGAGAGGTVALLAAWFLLSAGH
ncbi:MAG: hypothetical protein U0237_06705 [Thermoleophilia bacterium]